MDLKDRLLPLGIDIGTTAIRIAEFQAAGTRLSNIISVPLRAGTSESQIAAALKASAERLTGKERRCVLLVDDRDAIVREVQLPKMSRIERLRAARIEAKRFAPAEASRSIHLAAATPNSYTVGSADTAAIERLVRIARAAKFTVIAVDHASYAFARMYVQSDAVIDIGYSQTRFYALRAAVPFTLALDIGGNAFTQAVARAFAIDEESAENRKRLHGTAPAGEEETAALVHFIGRAMRAARNAGVADIERITLTGNGARLPQLAAKIERDTGCLVELASRLPGCEVAFPDDIVRAAAPDWSLACGAALWSAVSEVAA